MSPEPSPRIVGALLVGGASRRFGRPKALARLGGSTLAERVAAALAWVTGEVLVVGAGEVPESLSGLARIADAPGARGPVAGILGALDARPGAAVLAAACDQPLLDPKALSWLLGEWDGRAVALVGRREAARIEPLPGLYAASSRGRLEAFAKADGSLQPLGRDPAARAVPVPEAFARAWTSVDHPEALAELEAELGGFTTIDPPTRTSES